MRLGDLLPPIVFKTMNQPTSQPTFHSYEEALSTHKDFGYQQEELVNVVYLKTQRFRDSLSKRPLTVDHTCSRLLLALCIAARGKKKLTVDFGGACGAHCFVARAFFADDLELKWNVVETPAMAQMGRTLESDELRFLDSIDEGKHTGKADLVFSSGTLQYVSNPLQTLDELPRANYLFLTRLALLDKVGEGALSQCKSLD